MTQPATNKERQSSTPDDCAVAGNSPRVAAKFSIRHVRWWAACFVVLGLVTGIAGWTRRMYVVDDAFIFARVAHNITHGAGWAFNPSKPVNAMTSVLWTVLLAPFAWLHSLTIPSLCVLYGLGVFATALAIACMWRPSQPRLGIAIAAACAACSTQWDSVGLETSLEAALVAWTILAYCERREFLAGSALGLAVLARPDACLLGALLLAHGWLTRRSGLWRMVGPAGAVIVPWVIYALATFGGIVPVTLRTKTLQSSIGWWAKQPPFGIAAMLHSWWCIPAAVIAILGLLLARRTFMKMPSAVRLLVVYGVAHAVTYTAIRAPAGYYWYYVPLYLSLIVAGLWGAAVLLTSATAWVKQRVEGASFEGRDSAAIGRWWRLAGRNSASGALVAGLSAVGFLVGLARTSSPYRFATEYRQTAEVVRARRAPEDYVAATEIGYLGYFADCNVLGIHGLLHPEATQRIADGESTWWMERKARFVVTHVPAWFGEPGATGTPAEASTAFEQRYGVVHQVQSDSKNVLLLWERRDYSSSSL